MLLMPDPTSAILDPFTEEAATLSLICDVKDPITGKDYDKDRVSSRSAQAYLESTGIADTAYIGPECEFFVFDEVAYTLDTNKAGYAVDSAEGHWASGKAGLGYTVREGGLLPARAARRCTTCARGWCSRSGASESRANSTTTKSRPAASARST